MRQFTIVDRIQDAEFNFIERSSNIRFPIFFRNFMKKYGGQAIEENNYNSTGYGNFIIGQFLMFHEISSLSKEFREVYNRSLIPFAYDPGGWHFCLSFDEGSNGAIILNRWTDHKPEEQFLKIADSFEEFIDGLKREGE